MVRLGGHVANDRVLDGGLGRLAAGGRRGEDRCPPAFLRRPLTLLCGLVAGLGRLVLLLFGGDGRGIAVSGHALGHRRGVDR